MMSQNLFTWIFPTLVLIYIWSILDRWKGRWEKRPPGPLRVPILGNVLHMLPAVMDSTKTKPHSKSFLNLDKLMSFKPAYIIMHNLSKTFGPVMSIQFGINHAILIGNSKYAREVFCREEFAHRFADGWFVERSFGKPLGLIFNNDAPYKTVKNFTTKNLKDFGFGKKQSMEAAVEEELLDFLHHFQEKLEGSQDNTLLMSSLFTLPVLNILWNMVGGLRFSYDDHKLQNLVETVEELSRSFDIGGNILMAFPFLRFIAPNLTGHAHQMKLYSKLHEYFREILHERQSEGSYLGNPKDFIDIFLQQMDKNNNNTLKGKEKNLFTEEQWIMVALDLFTAGSETTANTLDFAILYMILNEDVQKKVQSEIDHVIGRSRLPNMADRQKMPYTEATLLECQRMCNVIPLVHRVATKDTEIGGYSVKRDDVMVVNLHSVHSDENFFPQAEKFLPSRFLDPLTGSLNSSAAFLPFGMGKRVCIGEQLAKLGLFTFFTAMLQRYSFQKAVKFPDPSTVNGKRKIDYNYEANPGKGFTICPDAFYAYIKPRT